MPSEEELFQAVDELLAGEPQLPPPAERARLREAAGVTQARLAKALQKTTQTVKNWENGRSEPRPPQLQAYLRLLEGWAQKYPAPVTDAPAAPAAPETFAVAPAPAAADDIAGPADAPNTAPAQPSSSRPAPKSGTARSSRRPAARKAAPAPAADSRFPHGPLAVLDGDGSAYGAGGLVLDCPAETIPQLVEWTLKESGLGAVRLHRNGKDADPLIVLTEAAAERFGLPVQLGGFTERRAQRLDEGHPVVKQIAKAKWKLTKRGFGPWPRIYRPADGGQRQCVQLAILPWNALDDRAWPGADQLPLAELARALGVYATRVLTPRGFTAVSGLELMTALRPPTRAVKDDATGTWISGHNPGSLGTQPVDPAPPEARPEHPVVVEQSWNKGFLDEEAYQWVRDPQLLTDEECLLPFAVGLDINTAFLSAAARLVVGLGAPEHVTRPVFDKKVPGSWLVDLSDIDLDPRLPSPFTPSGQRPEGPAWYATATVAYAEQLGYTVTPLEAYLRRETGAYLDPWHDHLKNAYLATMADLGVPVGKDVDEAAFLAAMEQHKQVDPGMAMVLSAIKSTVKGGVGKLREGPQGRHYAAGQRWPALERPTWRPDIRAAVISKARVNMHRKMLKTAEASGLFPLAVLSDCVVYPSPGPSPLDFLPRDADGKPVLGTFRLGPTPGLSKTEGVQEMAWAVDLMEKGYNPARHIKGGDAVLEEGE